jgi:hypothetical protein
MMLGNKRQGPLKFVGGSAYLFEGHGRSRAVGAGRLRLDRRGGSHDIYRWGEQMIPIPRHREINERLARDLLADLRRVVEGEA